MDALFFLGVVTVLFGIVFAVLCAALFVWRSFVPAMQGKRAKD